MTVTRETVLAVADWLEKQEGGDVHQCEADRLRTVATYAEWTVTRCADCKHMRAHQAGIAQSEAAPMHMVDALTCLAAQPFQCGDRKRMLETAKPMQEPCAGFEAKL